MAEGVAAQVASQAPSSPPEATPALVLVTATTKTNTPTGQKRWRPLAAIQASSSAQAGAPGPRSPAWTKKATIESGEEPLELLEVGAVAPERGLEHRYPCKTCKKMQATDQFPKAGIHCKSCDGGWDRLRRRCAAKGVANKLRELKRGNFQTAVGLMKEYIDATKNKSEFDIVAKLAELEKNKLEFDNVAKLAELEEAAPVKRPRL